MKKISSRDILTKIAKKLLEEGIVFKTTSDDNCHQTRGCHSPTTCHSSKSSSYSSGSGCHTSSRSSGHC